MILWESLSPEDQEKCLNELWNDTNWVIWCKANPKDMVTQLFREYGKYIFFGKCAKPKQVGDNQAESSGGKHVCYQGQKLVETGGCRRMRCPNEHAMLGAPRRNLQQ